MGKLEEKIVSICLLLDLGKMFLKFFREKDISGAMKKIGADNKPEFKIELKYLEGEPVIKKLPEFRLLEDVYIQKLRIFQEILMD